MAASPSTATNTFTVNLPPLTHANELLPESPFGINTAFNPETPDLDSRLKAMQEAGIKWGRQDFTWKRIEKTKGEYDWAPYDRLIEQCRQHGITLFGNLAYAPEFHDPRTADGVDAYCALARAAVKRYAGKIEHWQIWNEPNGGFWKGSPEQYARLL